MFKEALELISSWLFVYHLSSQILKLLRGEGDELNYWTKMKLANSKDIDGVVEDEYAENYGICDIQTHLTLAMLGVYDDVVSNSTPGQSLDLSLAKKTLEDYLYGRYSHLASFDWFTSASLNLIIFLTLVASVNSSLEYPKTMDSNLTYLGETLESSFSF